MSSLAILTHTPTESFKNDNNSHTNNQTNTFSSSDSFLKRKRKVKNRLTVARKKNKMPAATDPKPTRKRSLYTILRKWLTTLRQ